MPNVIIRLEALTIEKRLNENGYLREDARTDAGMAGQVLPRLPADRSEGMALARKAGAEMTEEQLAIIKKIRDGADNIYRGVGGDPELNQRGQDVQHAYFIRMYADDLIASAQTDRQG